MADLEMRQVVAEMLGMIADLAAEVESLRLTSSGDPRFQGRFAPPASDVRERAKALLEKVEALKK
jgi:hypothetical protein